MEDFCSLLTTPDLESGLWRFFSFHACSLDSTLLFSRRFDITLEIIVDYSRNERGVLDWLAGGWMDGWRRHTPCQDLGPHRAAPFEVAGKVGALRDVDFASSNTTGTKFSFVHIIYNQN